MALSLTDKIHVVRDEIPTANLGSALANSGRDSVSVQDIIDLAGASETGTWEPKIAAYYPGELIPVYVNRKGTYNLTGDVVTLTYDIEISSASTLNGSGLIVVMDFPFVIDTTKAFSHVTGKTKGTYKVGTMGGDPFFTQGTYFDYLEYPANSSPVFNQLSATNMSVSLFNGCHFRGIVSFTKL